MRITVVGGGSTYTPELVAGIARLRDVLGVRELVLQDPDAERLSVVAGLAARMLAHADADARVIPTTSLDEAVEGAAAVLVQLRVGGQDAREGDETFPLRCGCVGQETTGAGGLAKALRTVPVVLAVAEAARSRSPDAWIVDFTNPVGIVTRALLQEGHRAVGLCNVAIGFQRLFAQWLDTEPAQVRLDHVGLNHLTWIRRVEVAGTDCLPLLLDRHGAQLADRIGLPARLLQDLGLVPSYYLRYFYAHDEVVAEQRASPTRAAEVRALEQDLLRMYAEPDRATVPDLLSRRGGAYYSDAAVALIAGLLAGPSGTAAMSADEAPQVADVRNDGTLPFLPDEAVVEVPCRITVDGAHPLPMAPLDPLLAGLVAHVAAYEHLALDAALRGGRDRVVRALLAHPLVGQYDLAERLADDLLAGNRRHLPWA